MTKAELIVKIAEKANLTKANAERALNAFLETVEGTLVKEGKLTLTGFGTFNVDKRKARVGRNPPHRRRNQDSGYQGRQIPSWQNPQRRRQIIRRSSNDSR